MTSEQEKAAKAALARVQKNASALGRLTTAVQTADSWTATLTDLFTETGFSELFGFESVPTDAAAAARLRDVGDLLSKNRTGRLKDAAQGLQKLLEAMTSGRNQGNRALDPGKRAFWEAFFTAREQRDSAALGGFVAEVARNHRTAGRVLSSEVQSLLGSNGLGHVDLGAVGKLLSGQGIEILEDLKTPVFTAVRGAGVNVVALVLPSRFKDESQPHYTLRRDAKGGVVSVHQLETRALQEALKYYEQRGASMSARKKAITQLRATVSGRRPLAQVLITYHLQYVAALKAEKKMDNTIRRQLESEGLDDADIPRLLNERVDQPTSQQNWQPTSAPTPPQSRPAPTPANRQRRSAPKTSTSSAPRPRKTDLDKQDYGPVEALITQKKLRAAEQRIYQLNRNGTEPRTKYGSTVAGNFNDLAARFTRDVGTLSRLSSDNSGEGVARTLQMTAEIQSYCVDDPTVNSVHESRLRIWQDPAWRREHGPAAGLYLPPVPDTDNGEDDGPEPGDTKWMVMLFAIGAAVVGGIFGLFSPGGGNGLLEAAVVGALFTLIFGAWPTVLLPRTSGVLRKVLLWIFWIGFVLLAISGFRSYSVGALGMIAGLFVSLLAGIGAEGGNGAARSLRKAQGTVRRWNNFVEEYDRRLMVPGDSSVQIVRISHVGPEGNRRKCDLTTLFPTQLVGAARTQFLDGAAALTEGAVSVVEGKTVVACISGDDYENRTAAGELVRAVASVEN